MRRPAWAVIFAALSIGAAGLAGSTPNAEFPRLPGRPAPDLAAIFLPAHAPAGSYQLTVFAEPMEAVRARLMKSLAPGAAVDDPPGAWTVRPTTPLEAFGEGGRYDHSRLARLYAGRPALLLHAPIVRNSRVIASLTLISPRPDDRELTRLVPGTLAILFVVDAARGQGE